MDAGAGARAVAAQQGLGIAGLVEVADDEVREGFFPIVLFVGAVEYAAEDIGAKVFTHPGLFKLYPLFEC